MDINQLEIHPAAELFPMMSEDEYEGLRDDIAANGCEERLVVWRGYLIDGRNRLRACNEVGIEPDILVLPDNADPWDYVISHNLHRRHLTTSQRAVVAAKIAELQIGENQHSNEGVGKTTPSAKNAAESLNVDRSTVFKAKTVLKEGSPELVEAVERGEVSVNRAAEIAKTTPKEKQAEEAKKPKKKRKSALGNEYKPTKQETEKKEYEPWIEQEFSILEFRNELNYLLEDVPDDQRYVVGEVLQEAASKMME